MSALLQDVRRMRTTAELSSYVEDGVLDGEEGAQTQRRL